MKKRKLKKKYVLIFLLILIVLLALTITLIINKIENDKVQKHQEELENISISIARYNTQTDEEIEKKEIADSEEKEKVSNYISKIKHLGEHETIELLFLNDILIDYNDITIGIQIGESEICYYQAENKSEYAYLS